MTWILALGVVLGTIALSIVPLVVLLVIHADSLLESLGRARRRARKARQRVFEPAGPPVEKIASDLRRIGAARDESQLGSLGYTILTTQYDKQLVLGCRALGIAQQLDDLTGFDVDMGRLRGEGALGGAGLVFDGSSARQDVDG